MSRSGIIPENPVKKLDTLLDKLKRAPLKPQQKLVGVKDYIVLKFIHACTLSYSHVYVLKKFDARIRGFIRKILNLPHDTPNVYFHAGVNDGGLGILSLRDIVPGIRIRRLSNLKTKLSDEARNSPLNEYLEHRISQSLRIRPGVNYRDYQKEKLYRSCDGKALEMSSFTIGQHYWVEGGNRLLTGRDFIKCNKLRINALPTQSRLIRGRPGDRLCKAGCSRKETLNHILKSCPRTHGKRVARHNAFFNYIKRSAERHDVEIHCEPIIKGTHGVRKPDLAYKWGDLLVVIDGQIISDGYSLREGNRNKVAYYQEDRTLIQNLKSIYQVEDVKVIAATLNWRGVWAPESAKDLLDYCVIKKTDLNIISTRVLIGGLSCFNQFSKSTAYFRTSRPNLNRF